MTQPFITADWLAEHLDEVVLVDTRWYLDGRDGRRAYLEAHIPGARFIDLDTTLAAPPGPIVGRHPLPTPEVFATGLGEAGIHPEDTVVAYDDLGGMVAGRLVWMLRILERSAALLDGGLAAWAGATESGAVESSTVEYPPIAWPEEAIVDADGVDNHLHESGVLVDARGPERYRGEIEPIDPRPGHIPGATNLPYSSLLDGERLRGDAFEIVEAAGLNDQAIVYCGSGVSACLDILVAEAAGLGRPRLYVGSWSGWSSDPNRPSETTLPNA